MAWGGSPLPSPKPLRSSSSCSDCVSGDGGGERGMRSLLRKKRSSAKLRTGASSIAGTVYISVRDMVMKWDG